MADLLVFVVALVLVLAALTAWMWVQTIKEIRKPIWSRWYAWFPVVTIGKHVVWLSWVERRWIIEGGEQWGYDGYSGRDDGYQYRLPRHE